MRIRGRKTKKCPRCGNVCLLSQVKCDDCGLLFSKMDDATNHDGKIRLKNHEKEMVIYSKKCPPDIKRWKLILITIFFGLFGVHYFYVGRWKWGLALLIYFISVVLCGVVFNAYFLDIWNGTFFSIYGPLTGVYTIIWLNDIRRVCFNTFPIPVSILDVNEKAKIEEEKENKKNKKNREIIEESTENTAEKEIIVEEKTEDKE